MTTAPNRTGPSGPGAGSFLLVALALGLSAGLAEVAVVAIKRAIAPRVLFLSDAAVWMVPLTYGILFLVLGLVLWLAGRALKRIPPAALMAPLVGLAALVILLGVGRLHPAAMAVLVIGIAIQSARVLHRRLGSVVRFAALSATTLVVVVLLLAAGVPLLRRSDSDIPGLAAASRPAGPDIILLVLDTVRGMNLGLYGYPRATTPNLDQWAADAVRFDQAYSPSPWTLPGHASMFTGLPPHALSAGWLTPLDNRRATLAETLRSAGYQTAGFVANLNYTSRESGLARGFDQYEDYQATPATFVLSTGLGRLLISNRTSQWRMLRRPAHEINREFLHWLDHREDERPFFAFLNFFDAHDPYEAPPPFDRRFGTPRPLGPLNDRPGPGQSEHVRDAYDGTLAYLDAQLGKLMTELSDRGVLDHAIVVLTADHGEQLGENQLFLHGNSLYRAALRVPLVIRVPGPGRGRSVSVPVSTQDLAATVLDLAGIPRALPGHSLVPLLASDSAPGPGALVAELDYSPRLPRRTPIARGSMRSLIAEGMHLIRNGDGREELYDLVQDPFDTLDLAGRPEVAPLLARLRAELDQRVPPDARGPVPARRPGSRPATR